MTKAERTERLVLDLLYEKKAVGDLPTNLRFATYEDSE